MENEIDKVDNIKKEQERTIKSKAEFLEEYPKLIGIISATCQQVGISRQAYYKWIADDKEFKEAVEELSIQQRGDVEDRLIKAIAKGNIAAIIFYLKSKHPDYKPKMDVKATYDQKEMDELAAAMKVDLDKRGGNGEDNKEDKKE